MANVVTFDWDNLRIVEISTGGDNELDIVEVYSEWKDALLADPTRVGYPPAFRQVGSDPISATQNLGSTFFLTNGWRIRPAELSHKLTVVGNLFTDPAGSSVFVDTLGAFTVNTESRVSNLVDSVLVNSPDIQFSSFGGGVTLDESSPYSGTTYPIGTPRQPVNNLADAMSIATARGFTTIVVIGDATIDSNGNYVGIRFVGESATKSALTISAGANVTNAEFSDATVSGTLDGGTQLKDCRITTLNYVDGFVERCILAGTVTLSGVNTARFLDCWSDEIATAPTIDVGGSGSALVMQNYSGALTIKNKTSTDECTINLSQGQVTLDSTVSAGTIQVRGVGEPTVNNSTGTAVLDNSGLLTGQKLDEIHEATATRGLVV